MSKLTNARKLSITLLIVSVLMLSTIFISIPVKAEGAATVWTDKSDYAPEETVMIFGSGFNSYFDITVNVERPDGIIDTICAKADESGSFTAYYVLDGITGTYIVTASDGINVATTTFTDAAKISSVKSSGQSYPPEKNSFSTDEDVYAVVISDSGSGSKSFYIYVVSSLPSMGGNLIDVSGGYENFTISGKGTYGPYKIWPATTTAGNYYIVVDANTNEKYDEGDVYDTFEISSPPAQVYDVTFTESGLPAGTEWSVTFDSVTQSSKSNTITFTGVSAGSYSWSVSTPISGGTGVQYIASPSSGTMNVPSQISQSITYTTQYYLTVISPYGTTGGEGWYDAGTTAYATVTPLTVDVPPDVRYVFTYWSGDASGTTSPSDSITMDAPKTAVANWKTQYYLTVNTNPAEVLTLDPTAVSGQGWYDSGSTAIVDAVQNVDKVAGQSRYDFRSWTGAIPTGDGNKATVLMDGPKTAIANYQLQYKIIFDQTGVGTDFTGTVVTIDSTNYDRNGASFWWDENSSHHFAFASPLVVDGGKRYVWTSTSGLSTLQSGTLTITTSGSVTGNYKTQFRVNIGWSGLDSDATGEVVTITVGGIDSIKNAGNPFFDEWIDSGTSVSYSYELIVDSTTLNKAYKLVSVTGTSTDASHDFGLINGPISETGNYGSIILSITKKAPSAVFVGDTIRYIYEVTNTGTTSATDITVSDGLLTVSFVGGDVDGDNELDPKETWVYTATYGPVSADDMHSIGNTAVVSCYEEATAEDTATVYVYQLVVTKTAETSFTRTYTWTISKTADPSSLIFSSGTDTQTVKYSIALSATYKDSDWRVTGTITIHNPAPIPAVITSIKDVVSPDIAAKIDFGSVTFPYTLGAGKTLTLTYSADLPNADSRTNTVTVTMQNYERPFLWDLTGDWVIRVHYGGTYDHDFSLKMASDGLAFTGTGGYPASGPPYSITETITGVTAVNDVFWHSLYNNGYFWDAKGTVAPDGKMSGTWTSNAGQSGTWESISGAAKLVKTETTTSDLTATADVVFGKPTTEIDECVTVTDTYSGGPQGVTVAYPGETLTYDRVIGPYANIGIYTVENTASFVTCDTGTTGSDDCTVTVYRIGSAVTTSSFYLFDFDNANGRQFKLIYTPDVPTNPSLYRLTASNPGQFYYNIFYYGGVSTPFTITIPEPFVTQGANPVHIYDSIGTSGNYLLPAGNDITYLFTITPTYSDGGDFTGFIVKPNDGYSGPVYITIHLDYGYKKTLGGLSKDASNDASGSSVTICDLTNYMFSVSVSESWTDSDTVQNRNVFKRDPGFVGLITDSEGNPIEGVKVQIYGPDGKLLATVYTDKDGWYFYNYKYTGKAASFTIKLPEYNKTATVTIKSNSLTKTDFIIP
jgi:hypothetical protein